MCVHYCVCARARKPARLSVCIDCPPIAESSYTLPFIAALSFRLLLLPLPLAIYRHNATL